MRTITVHEDSEFSTSSDFDTLSDFHINPKADGGYDGASRTSKELATWSAPIAPADVMINGVKDTSDARVQDLLRNDGYAVGAMQIHKDSIVGGQFVLNSRPDWRVLGLDETWAEEFQIEAESKFTLGAESIDNWFDAAQINTFTQLIRLGVGIFTYSGEILAAVEWIRRVGRPFNTAIQFIELARLSNPRGDADSNTIRGGVERDFFGAPIAYHIREEHPYAPYDLTGSSYSWKRVPARKPWGRVQMIHIIEQSRPDQSRGIADMVASLKKFKMTQKFQDVMLQNAVLNATYAATIESELPPEAAYQALGMGGQSEWAAQYLTAIAAYSGNSRNLLIDGIKIPHLYPGTKLHLQNPGKMEGIGSEFEQSLLRHISASLGLSYEQFSRDYTKTNYSSARASMNETYKFMQARKKNVADKLADHIYSLWLEEMINKGQIESMPRNAPSFYEGLNKAAYCRARWIGAARGQIDELKETEAAVMRIEKGLSTFEAEIARFGEDFREVFAQQAREKTLRKKLGIEISLSPSDQLKLKENSDNRRSEETAAMSKAFSEVATAIANQPAPVVTVSPAAAPVVNVESPVVNVTPAATNVTINQPKPGSVTQHMKYDELGNLVSLTTTPDEEI